MEKLIFLYVLNGVIVGMGLAKLISGYASFFEKRQKYETYWVHTNISIIIFVLLAQYWFMLLTWEVPLKSFWIYLLSLIYPIILYLICYLLYPDTSLLKIDEIPYSLKKHYYDNRKWLFGVSVPAFLIAIIHNLINEPQNLITKPQGLRVSGLIIVVSLFVSKKPRLHSVGSIVILFLLFTFLIEKYDLAEAINFM